MSLYLNGTKYVGAYMNGQKVNGYFNGNKIFNYTVNITVIMNSASNSKNFINQTVAVPSGHSYTLNDLKKYGFDTGFDYEVGNPSFYANSDKTLTYSVPVDPNNSGTWPGEISFPKYDSAYLTDANSGNPIGGFNAGNEATSGGNSITTIFFSHDYPLYYAPFPDDMIQDDYFISHSYKTDNHNVFENANFDPAKAPIDKIYKDTAGNSWYHVSTITYHTINDPIDNFSDDEYVNPSGPAATGSVYGFWAYSCDSGVAVSNV